MRSVLATFAVVVVSCVGSVRLVPAREPDSAAEIDPAVDRALTTLFNDYYEQYLTLFPLEATAFGDARYNDSLPIRISPDFLAKERAFYQGTLQRLEPIDSRRTSDASQLAAAILAYELRTRLQGMDFHNERIPWNQFDGLPLASVSWEAGLATNHLNR